ncbi:MAG TPA: RluA family pseudouridine synthase [Roseiarcus sp.]|nr:RluA family pseudouridine synthase [Roseiarcus sp.]
MGSPVKIRAKRERRAAEAPNFEPASPRPTGRAASAPVETALRRPIRFEVEPGAAGERLDRYLAGAAAEASLGYSRTRLKALIEGGEVFVNGEAAHEPSAKLSAGDRISLTPPLAEASGLVGEQMALDIRFEDDYLLILNKPAGLVVHPSAGHAKGTLVHALLAHCGASLSGVGGVKRPGIVHRLDKDTSGLIVVAKTDAAHRGLAALFADHGRAGALEREYLALVWGAMEKSGGTISAPIARHPKRREKMAVAPAGRGRAAVTHWRLLKALGPVSLIACRLETGRTHQIRVHLSHIGHSLLGDPIYGAGFKSKATRLPAKAQALLERLGRQALHAAKLGFVHPVTGRALAFESALPADFLKLVKALETIYG